MLFSGWISATSTIACPRSTSTSMSVRLAVIIFTELLLPIRRKTPGVNKTSALPFSVVKDWPGCNSAEPIDFEVRACSPIEAWPSTELRVPGTADFALASLPHAGAVRIVARKKHAMAPNLGSRICHLLLVFSPGLDDVARSCDARDISSDDI